MDPATADVAEARAPSREKRARRKGPLRRFTKWASRRIVLVLVPFLAFALYLVMRTWRIRIVRYGGIAAEHLAGRNVIYAIGHGRMLVPAWVMRRRGIRVLISEHFDGELITRIVSCFGFGAARGSATRGGAKALRELLRDAREADLAVTPDGPRGPFLSVKPGLAFLAARTKLAICCASFDADRKIQMKTWDRFRLPLPWARVVIAVAPPRVIPKDADEARLEAERLAIEEDLRRIDEEATLLARRSAREVVRDRSMVSVPPDDQLVRPGGRACDRGSHRTGRRDAP